MNPETLRRIERRNLFLNTGEGAIYIASSGLISPQTVLPALVLRLGGTNVEVGMLTVVTYLGMFFPQIFAARYVETLAWKKPWAVWMGTAQRICILLIGLSVLLFGHLPGTAGLWAFSLLFLANQVMGGIATPGWFDFFVKVTSTKKRGRLLGFRNALGGIGGLLSGILLTWLLASYAFPAGYVVAFFIAFLFQMTSIVLQNKIVEIEPSPTIKRKPFFSYLMGLPSVIRKNREFSRFLVASAFLVMATMPTGFFTVRALKDFGADESMVGLYTLTIIVVQGVSSLGIGYLIDRYGNKLALLCASVAMGCASLLALIAPSPFWYIVVFMFLGVNLGADVMARYNLSVEYGTPEQRSTYVGLMNTILAPFYLAGVVGGIIGDAFGYPILFLVGVLLSIIGIYLLVTRVREPRTLAGPPVTEVPA